LSRVCNTAFHLDFIHFAEKHMTSGLTIEEKKKRIMGEYIGLLPVLMHSSEKTIACGNLV
jgi:hypothetical protein